MVSRLWTCLFSIAGYLEAFDADVSRVARVLGYFAWARAPFVGVDVARIPARFAWGEFVSITSIGAWAPFACHGGRTFGAWYATSYAVVIRLTTSGAIDGSVSDFSWVALV